MGSHKLRIKNQKNVGVCLPKGRHCRLRLRGTSKNVGVCLPKGRHRRLRLRGTSKYVNRELRWGVQLPQKNKK